MKEGVVSPPPAKAAAPGSKWKRNLAVFGAAHAALQNVDSVHLGQSSEQLLAGNKGYSAARGPAPVTVQEAHKGFLTPIHPATNKPMSLEELDEHFGGYTRNLDQMQSIVRAVLSSLDFDFATGKFANWNAVEEDVHVYGMTPGQVISNQIYGVTDASGQHAGAWVRSLLGGRGPRMQHFAFYLGKGYVLGVAGEGPRGAPLVQLETLAHYQLHQLRGQTEVYTYEFYQNGIKSDSFTAEAISQRVPRMIQVLHPGSKVYREAHNYDMFHLSCESIATFIGTGILSGSNINVQMIAVSAAVLALKGAVYSVTGYRALKEGIERLALTKLACLSTLTSALNCPCVEARGDSTTCKVGGTKSGKCKFGDIQDVGEPRRKVAWAQYGLKADKLKIRRPMNLYAMCSPVEGTGSWTATAAPQPAKKT
jgi:hypothetical protein